MALPMAVPAAVAPIALSLAVPPITVPTAVQPLTLFQIQRQQDQTFFIKRSIARLPAELYREAHRLRELGRCESEVVAKQFIICTRYAAKAALVRKGLAKLVQGGGGTERFVPLDSEFADPKNKLDYLPGKSACYGPAETSEQRRLQLYEVLAELPKSWSDQFQQRVQVFEFQLNVYSTNKNNRDTGPKEQTEVRPILSFSLVGVAGYYYRTDNQGRYFLVKCGVSAPSTIILQQPPTALQLPAALQLTPALQPPAALQPLAAPEQPAAAPEEPAAALQLPAAPEEPLAAPEQPVAAPEQLNEKQAKQQKAIAKIVLETLNGAEFEASQMEAAASAAATAAMETLLDDDMNYDGSFHPSNIAAASAAAHAAAAALPKDCKLASHETTEVGVYLGRLCLDRYQQIFYSAEIYTLKELSYWNTARMKVRRSNEPRRLRFDAKRPRVGAKCFV